MNSQMEPRTIRAGLVKTNRRPRFNGRSLTLKLDFFGCQCNLVCFCDLICRLLKKLIKMCKICSRHSKKSQYRPDFSVWTSYQFELSLIVKKPFLKRYHSMSHIVWFIWYNEFRGLRGISFYTVEHKEKCRFPCIDTAIF